MRFLLLIKRNLLALCLALICCLAGGPARAAGEDHGTTRIVSLVPNATELLFALGAADQVAGVSEFCRYPEEARSRPSVGGLINPSLEKVLALRPRVVILYRSQVDFAGKLKSLGVDSRLLSMDSLADLYAGLATLGSVTGRQAEAARLTSEIQTGLDQVRAEAAANNQTTSPMSGIVIVSREPGTLRSMYQAARGEFLGELFQLAGGRLAIPEGPPISAEAVVRANPDIILDLTGSENGETSAPIKAQPGAWAILTTVNAVKQGHVYHWFDPHRMLLGPGVVDTARGFLKALKSR